MIPGCLNDSQHIYEDTREEGERLQKVWLASGGSFGGLLRFVPSLPPSQIYSDTILQLVLSGWSQPGGENQEVDQPEMPPPCGDD